MPRSGAQPVVVGPQDFRFECQAGCSECCTQRGYVYLTSTDVDEASKFLGCSPIEFRERYCEFVEGDWRLTNPSEFSCHFLDGERCSIHPAKPVQCQTFPFWPEVVDTKRNWKRQAKTCPGIGEGPVIPIHEVRAAAQACKDAFPKG